MIKHKQNLRHLAPYLSKWRTSWMLRYMSVGVDKGSINPSLTWGYRNGMLDRKEAKKIAFASRDRRDNSVWAYRIKREYYEESDT